MKTAALGVRNLTDARYFAAMAVDWIGFDLSADSPLTIEHIVVFADWVEGPRLMLDVRGRSTDEIAEYLSALEADALLVDNNVDLVYYGGQIAMMNDSDADIMITAEMQQAQNAPDAWWIVNDPQMIISADSLPDCTIAVTGGDEDKVGIKDYEVLDAIFDALGSRT